MTTIAAWRFETASGAEQAADILRRAADDGLVTVVDHAVVSWPDGARRPEVHHAHEAAAHDTGWGSLWGLLLGAVFFVPLLGAAAGAAAGAVAHHLSGVGITKDEVERIRRDVRPGTSALFAVTEDADLDRLGERFHGLHHTLLETNLTDAERAVLRETFD